MFIQRERKKTHQKKPIKIINLAWGTKVQCYCLIFLFVVRCLENRKHCFALLYRNISQLCIQSQSESLITRITINGMKMTGTQYQVQFVRKKYHRVLHHSTHISEISSINVKTPPHQKKRKSHLLPSHPCETLAKSNQKWVLCFSQKIPLFSDKNKDYRIMLSIFQRRKNLGRFLGFSLNYIYIPLCW